MNSIEYTDYIVHGRTKGSKNGVSHTKGYDAVGKPAMTEAERKARRKLYNKNDKDATKTFFEGTKQVVESWSPKPNKKANVYNLPTKKIESINRRDRAISEYNRAHPSKGERAKSRTLAMISAASGITMAAFSGMYLYDRAMGTKTGQRVKRKVADMLLKIGNEIAVRGG